jgi:DNA polymerase-3 subunit gamma/tau
LARQVVDYLRNLMLVRMGNAALVEAGAETRASMARQAERLDMPALLRAIRAFNTAANDARGGWQPQLPLELAMVECVTTPAVAPASATPAPAQTAASSVRSASRPVPAANPPPGPAPARPARTERPAAPVRSEAARSAPARESRPAVPPSEAPPAENVRSAAELKGDWGRLLKLMRERDKMTEALLNSCSLGGMEGQVLRLTTSEFVYQKISADGATREKIEDMLAEVMGFTCTVQFEVSGRKARSARADDIPQDGLVATALDLGGEIVDE